MIFLFYHRRPCYLCFYRVFFTGSNIYRLPFVRFCTDSTNKKTRTSIKKKERPCIFVCRFSVNFISFFACYRYFIITRSKTFISIGLATWSFMPASSAACRSSEKAFAVIARMGISAFFRSSICLIFFVVS